MSECESCLSLGRREREKIVNSESWSENDFLVLVDSMYSIGGTSV